MFIPILVSIPYPHSGLVSIPYPHWPCLHFIPTLALSTFHAYNLSLSPFYTHTQTLSLFHTHNQVEKCLRGQTRFIVLETRNDGVRFTTSSLRNLSEEHLSLRNQYQASQATLAGEVLNIASGYAEPLLELNRLLAELDVIVSFAHVSASAPVSYVRPTITPRGL